MLEGRERWLYAFLAQLLRDRDLAAPRVEIKCRTPHAIFIVLSP